jgi:hypothetical protein
MSKKILKMVILMLLGFGSVFTPNGWANEFGLKAGYQYYEGIRAGLFYTVDLGDTFALQPEVYYYQRKFKVGPNEWFDILDKNSYDKVQFIEIPVLLKFKTNLSPRFKPSLFAGGYAGFRMSQESYTNLILLALSRYKQVDAGLMLGVGLETYERGYRKTKIHIDLRWNIGLVNFQELTPYLGDTLVVCGCGCITPKYSKNRSVSILVGVSF